jgi:hypothetical protein
VQLEACDWLEGFLLLQSVAGGTGAGLGTYLAEALADDFRQGPLVNVCVWWVPSWGPWALLHAGVAVCWLLGGTCIRGQKTTHAVQGAWRVNATVASLTKSTCFGQSSSSCVSTLPQQHAPTALVPAVHTRRPSCLLASTRSTPSLYAARCRALSRPYESGEVAVQPYNALLTLSHLSSVSDGLLLLQNEVLHATCTKLLGVQRPGFTVRPQRTRDHSKSLRFCYPCVRRTSLPFCLPSCSATTIFCPKGLYAPVKFHLPPAMAPPHPSQDLNGVAAKALAAALLPAWPRPAAGAPAQSPPRAAPGPGAGAGRQQPQQAAGGSLGRVALHPLGDRAAHLTAHPRCGRTALGCCFCSSCSSSSHSSSCLQLPADRWQPCDAHANLLLRRRA